MPKIIFNVGPGLKELWVEAAHQERVSLSEWIRRACAERLERESKGPIETVRARRAVVADAEDRSVKGRTLAAGDEGLGQRGAERPGREAPAPAASEDDPFIKALTEHMVETISEPGETSAVEELHYVVDATPEPLQPSTNPSILEGPKEFKPDFKGEPAKKKRR